MAITTKLRPHVMSVDAAIFISPWLIASLDLLELLNLMFFHNSDLQGTVINPFLSCLSSPARISGRSGAHFCLKGDHGCAQHIYICAVLRYTTRANVSHQSLMLYGIRAFSRISNGRLSLSHPSSPSISTDATYVGVKMPRSSTRAPSVFLEGDLDQQLEEIFKKYHPKTKEAFSKLVDQFRTRNPMPVRRVISVYLNIVQIEKFLIKNTFERWFAFYYSCARLALKQGTVPQIGPFPPHRNWNPPLPYHDVKLVVKPTRTVADHLTRLYAKLSIALKSLGVPMLREGINSIVMPLTRRRKRLKTPVQRTVEEGIGHQGQYFATRPTRHIHSFMIQQCSDNSLHRQQMRALSSP